MLHLNFAIFMCVYVLAYCLTSRYVDELYDQSLKRESLLDLLDFAWDRR